MQMCILLFCTKGIKYMEPIYNTNTKDGSPKMPDLDCVVEAATPSILLKPLLHHPEYMRYHIL
jgi:hypothetical protein